MARPTYKRPIRSVNRPTSAGIRVSPLVLWVGVAVIGVLLIVSFEWGYSAGRWRAAKRRERAQTEVAAAPTQARREPAPEPVSKPREKDPPRLPATEPDVASVELPPRPKRPEPVPPKPQPTPPDPPPAVVPAPTVALTFASNIQPIFQAKCVNCHGGLSKKGGLDLRTLTALTRGGNGGPGVVPNKPSASPVWETVESGQMPPKNRPQLTPAEKKMIRDWIAAGAK